MNWKLSEAKNRLSEVMSRALEECPQRIERRGEAVVVLAEKDYRRLTGDRPPFIDYLLNGPSLDGVDLERDRSPMGDVSP